MSSLSSNILINPQDLFDITVAGTVGTTSGVYNDGAKLGCLAVTGDGREFRYAIAGASALVPGNLLQGSAETTGWERLAIAASAAGTTSITTTTTITATANQLIGGYAVVSTTPGIGYNYKISGNTAASGAVATIYLEDPIQVALTTASQVSLVADPFNGVIVTTGSSEGTAAVVGVAVAATPATYYGWIQIAGPANVLTSGTIVVGESVVESTGTAGAVIAATSVSPVVGYAMQGITSGQNGPIYLTIG